MLDRLLALFGITGIRASWFRRDVKAAVVFAFVVAAWAVSQLEACAVIGRFVW